MRWIFGFLIRAVPVAGLAEGGSLLGGSAFGQVRSVSSVQRHNQQWC